jgi:hypothetical protein
MSKEKVRLKREFNRLRRQKKVLWAGVLFLVAILIWTGVSIFTSQKKVKIDQNLVNLAKPFVPRLDNEIFSMIEQKRFLSDEELEFFPIFVYLTTDSNQEGVLTDINNLSGNNEEDDESAENEVNEENGEQSEADQESFSDENFLNEELIVDESSGEAEIEGDVERIEGDE